MYKVESPRIKKQKSQQNDKLVPNLSQLYIQIPKPQFSTKNSSVNPYQLPQQLSNHNYYSTSTQQDLNKLSQNISSNKIDINDMLFSHSKTKSSSKNYSYRSETQIIKQWVKGIFDKRKLLADWQQRLKKKKKVFLKQSFLLLKQQYKQKQQNKSQCLYLQTQSKYKSFKRKDQHLTKMALQSFKKINNKFQNKIKKNSFSMILRYLIFNKYQYKSQKIDKKQLKQSKIIYQAITPIKNPQNQHYINNKRKINCQIQRNNINIKIITIEANSKQNKTRNNISQQFAIRQQQKRSMFLGDNQYALNPLSPSSKFKHEKGNNQNIHFQKKKEHIQHAPLYPDNRQIPNTPPVRHSPSIHINKYDEYISINRPQTPKKTPQIYHNNPLTPKRIVIHPQQVNNIAQNQLNMYNNQHQAIHQYVENNRISENIQNQVNYRQLTNSNKRQSHYSNKDTYKRPISHSPFNHILHQPIINDASQPDHLQNNHNCLRKSRSNSFSQKIKLQEIRYQQHNINVPQTYNNLNNDYQDSTHKLRISKDRGLGLQNRKIRESYQKNSYNNELIQDNMMNNHEKYIKSNPISPVYHNDFKTKLNEQQYYYVKSQQSGRQSSPRSSHNIFGKHSFMPIQKQVQINQQRNNPHMRKSLDIYSNGQNSSKKLNKDKLAITQKIKYN